MEDYVTEKILILLNRALMAKILFLLNVVTVQNTLCYFSLLLNFYLAASTLSKSQIALASPAISAATDDLKRTKTFLYPDPVRCKSAD